MKASGTDGDSYHYAMLDSDAESGTDHAQYRQYSSTQGRWLSPDLYSGSYDFTNPQSFNRYTYAENNPLANVDPSGLATCQTCRGDLFGPGGLFYYDGSGEFTFGSGWNEFDTYSSSTYYDVYTPNGDDYLFSDGVWGGIMDGDNPGITLTGGDAGDIWAAGGDTGYSVDEFSDTEMVGMALTTSSVPIGNISTRQSMSIYISQSSAPNNNIYSMDQDERIKELAVGITKDSHCAASSLFQGYANIAQDAVPVPLAVSSVAGKLAGMLVTVVSIAADIWNAAGAYAKCF